ncbi:TPA: prolipoprotein diacylglyceryl transferase [Candidatus Peregrinibacteria bacterium]|nr:prolipoprotein diacylglyceryl transferase [Candidatus Peregrinibacteria bacterium]HIQ57345.1 prolipoprotein diacylglyceryl transferase [Candidatus Gracilibacteria bacterium]
MSFEFFPQPNVILQIGSISLYFYGAMYALSAISAYFITQYWVQKFQIKNCTHDDILDIIFWSMISGVVGGRIFYMLVYNFQNFLEDLLSIFTVWNGGMSIHGGLIGGAIGFIIITKIKRINVLEFADIAVVSIAFGMALGRLGNFVNKELVGRVTDISWAIDFGDGLMRHPSQLYAMGKDLMLFFIFWYILLKISDNKNYTSGIIFSGFIVTYAIFRFIVEFFRQPDPQLGFIFLEFSMGQILSVALFFVGAFSFFIVRRKK